MLLKSAVDRYDIDTDAFTASTNISAVASIVSTALRIVDRYCIDTMLYLCSIDAISYQLINILSTQCQFMPYRLTQFTALLLLFLLLLLLLLLLFLLLLLLLLWPCPIMLIVGFNALTIPISISILILISISFIVHCSVRCAAAASSAAVSARSHLWFDCGVASIFHHVCCWCRRQERRQQCRRQ